MNALIVIDAQNEFSANGKRPVPNFEQATHVIRERVGEARREHRPIAWVRHFNKPGESLAFVPGKWGAEFYEGFGPNPGRSLEKEFRKNVYGAFTGSNIGEWLATLDVDEVLVTGFYTHGCVSDDFSVLQLAFHSVSLGATRYSLAQTNAVAQRQ